MINLKPFANSILLIVIPLYKIFTRYIINIRSFWWIEPHMIRSARTRMYTTSTHPFNNFFILNINFNDMVNPDSIFTGALGGATFAYRAVVEEGKTAEARE